ncbi:CshA/CshB family fibrillar adhesin-related protein [Nocardioides sp. SYSU D00065]|uniref:CshA/CshB family fibrillar adhesin-related protein n=1 Tax=Nocardioides sp. SYSU D00065 TaxID=2817378 RepID=UPI001B31F41A|nr:CshA/CshB family fibrillar adhesin-related protein [Nocardioides sp. SYSU D00065]
MPIGRRQQATSARTRGGRTQVLVRALCLITLLVSTMTAVSGVEPAEARYATGGTGAYRGSIDWFEWGTAGQAIPAAGLTRTNTRTVAGQALVTTCRIGAPSGGALRAYRPGSYTGDGLDDMYNIGGTGGANQLVTGLAGANGTTITFTLSCSVTLGGVAVPLAGLVMADAEASGSNEFIQATIPAGADWRVIDRYRSPGCTQTATLTRTGQTLRATGPTAACPTYPTTVAFMERASSATVTIRGGGVSAIALGVMLFTDFGDAPATYGQAGSLYSPAFAGGVVPQGNSSLFGTALATPTQPATRLGATVDAEPAPQPSATASSDGGDDGVVMPAQTAVTPGNPYTLPNVRCTGPGFVSGWIDWNRNGVFDAGERSGAPVSCPASGVTSLTWTVPADARAGASFARLRIGPTAATAGSPTGITTAGEVEDYAVNLVLPTLRLTKTSDATTATRVGDTVTYTVTATNTAAVPFTAAYPAVVMDSLAGVLDDGDYNGDLAASQPGARAYDEPVLSWSGALAAGASVTLTYSVTLHRGGDSTVRNVAFVPPCNPAAATCDPAPPAQCVNGVDPATGLACAAHVYLLPRLTVNKSADTTELPAVGQPVTYTVVATNPGPGTYTADAPAYVVDDLTDVLDDADLVAGSVAANRGAAPVVSGTRITWSGALAPGESVRLTYSVVYDAAGDNRLVNVAFGPPDPADPTPVCNPPLNGVDPATGAPCDRNQIPGAELTVAKTASPPTGTTVAAGEAVTYTLSFENDGAAAAAVDWTDDLAGVLDDAAVIDGPTSSAPSLTASPIAGGRFTVTGTVPAGDTVTVTYRVRVLADGQRGDDVLVNHLVPGDAPVPAECVPTELLCTVHPVPQLVDSKTVDPASHTTVVAGQELTYTLTFANNGAAPGAIDREDDLTHLLDDGVVVSAPASSDPALTVSGIVDGRFSISGTLAPDQTVTVTYVVRVRPDGDRGDDVLANYLLDPDVAPPSRPVCAVGSEDCTRNPVPEIVDSKSVDPASHTTVVAGQELTYTLTFTNTGAAAGTVDRVDDLSHVLDDGSVTSQPVASDAALSVSAIADGRFAITGSLAAGQTVTVTYVVTVGADGDRGDDVLANFLLDPDAPTPTTPACAPGSEDCTRNPVPEIVDSKSVDPASHTTVVAGQELTYTLTFTNNGAAPGTVDRVDDLTHVLDDGAVTSQPVASDAALSVTPVAGGRFSITGELGAGQTVTVTYVVRVRPDGDRGDNVLANFLLNRTQDPPLSPDCAEGSEDCTRNPVPEIVDSKSVDPASHTTVVAGQELTYTLTFRNIGAAAGAVDRVDDLSHVLDDGSVISQPVVSDAALSVSAVADGRFAITGSLAAGQTVTVTYVVRVGADGARGDDVLANFLLDPDAPTPSTPACAPGSEDCTRNPVPEIVDSKSVDPASHTTVVAGQELTYTLTFRNTGAAAGTVDRVDDLSRVLDDATVVTGPRSSAPALTVSPISGGRFSVTGELAAGQTVTVTYVVRVLGDAARGDNVLENHLLRPQQPLPDTCEAGSEDCTRNPVPEIVDSKSVDPASHTTVVAGQELTYTLTFRNIGAAAGAVDRVDDLSHVLDDGSVISQPVVSDAALSVSAVADGRFAITGSLAAGQTVTVTYVVRVGADGARGDDVLANFLLDPDAPTPTTPACAPGSEDCTRNPVPEIVDSKSVDPASHTTVVAGQELTYTLTFRNTGAAAGTVDRVDDLSRVLDDATVVTGPRSSAPALTVSPISGGRFSVTGELAAGQTVTVTYVVRVLGDAARGDNVLENHLLRPQQPLPDTCEAGSEDCTRNPVPEIVDSKSVDPASHTTVVAGQELTYTLTFRNIGAAAGTVDRVDDLSHVLDDARIITAPAASDTALAVSAVSGGRFAITGRLAAGQTVTVSYTVRVNGPGQAGDHVLANFLLDRDAPNPTTPTCEPGSEDCTRNPVSQIVDTKTVDPASGTTVLAGQHLTYTLTFLSVGAAAGTVHRVDDLTHLLDDATLTTAPVASDPALAVSEVADGRFAVTGRLAAGQEVTVTYVVTVKADGGRGDNLLGNHLLDPGQPTPPTPGCPSGAEDCTSNPVPEIVDHKSVDPRDGTLVDAGQQLTYTLTFTNRGAGPGAVDKVDDLTHVLDDAVVVTAPRSSDPALSVSAIGGSRFSVTGTLRAGQTVTVTYGLEVKKAGKQGDGMLVNHLLEPGAPLPPLGECDAAGTAGEDSTCNPVRQFDLSLAKSVVSGPRATVGDRVRYRLQVANKGPDATRGPITLVDRLPNGLELVSAKGSGWSCKARKATDTVTCVTTAELRSGAKAPAVHIVARTTKAATRKGLVNVATVSVAGDTVRANNKDKAKVIVRPVPHLPETGFRWVV